MVEQLTQKNLTLEEKLREQEEIINDLEQMREMDDELQEEIQKREREMQQELDLARGEINKLTLELKAMHSIIKDRESTIDKFRRLVQQLQEEIQDLKDRLEIVHQKQTGRADEDGSADYRSVFAQSKQLAEVIRIIIIESSGILGVGGRDGLGERERILFGTQKLKIFFELFAQLKRIFDNCFFSVSYFYFPFVFSKNFYPRLPFSQLIDAQLILLFIIDRGWRIAQD